MLPDTPEVHVLWRRLLVAHAVSGVQVHDARLAAAMLVHGVNRILTFNTLDFARFTGIQAVNPADLS
jgi:predicted nucleic acid-binding protein